VAQMVVKQVIEPILDPVFLADSYGYRPRKSALDAVGVTRERCWKYDWVLEFDIKGLFDNISHELLVRAVRKHVACRWALLEIERVVDLPWCRYADDGLMHCRNEQEAQALKSELQARLAEWHLEMHPTKTKIVYCKDKKQKGTYPNVQFDFLGYCFRPRLVKRPRDNTLFCGFNPAVSSTAMKAMRSTIRELKLRHQTQLSLQNIARQLNPLLRGWIEYYGRYASSALYPLLRHINQMLVAWMMRKFKRFKGHKVRASQFQQRLATEQRAPFVHWDIGMTGVFN
jgi:RNA-directed DNA polymerase